MKSTGIKHDKGKPALSMIPIEGIEGIAQALTYGANKYGKDNYKGGMDWTRLLDAALRHLYAYASGQNLDKESGLSHVDHAMANLVMLQYVIKRKVGNDNR